ncbi:NAD(P)H-hydrate epimerase [Drechslerella stenobrocha 248]|uniref:NAD(P)H-hydrate epimerase n=1 Tax=Drechslerella stenobrocha 248 TaxID=1043628 RepID=W7I7Q6_9PEZI|nr:NAD(P)H-hydrate epimerase [Drechslerella stenobrocha 248]
MSTGGFSLDQLMELAGLSVSQAVYIVHPPDKGNRVLVLCGPGNNGGDGLVAARHLWYFGYKPTVYFPKQGRNEIYERLSIQLRNLGVPFTDDYKTALSETDHIVDAIFGFSFSGAVRPPFDNVIEAIKSSGISVTSVDAPSSWDIENGPPPDGPGKDFMPAALVSLTAPKPLARFFTSAAASCRQIWRRSMACT